MGNKRQLKIKNAKLRYWISASTFLIFNFALPFVLPACRKSQSSMEAGKILYYCPMHPSYTSDKPGNCPICQMRLVPKTPSPSAPSGPRKILYYRNPMDPRVISSTPAKDSMGMDYVPVYADETEAPEKSVPGSIVISENRGQAIGVRVESVETRELFSNIRASARVAYDPGLYSAILEHQQAVSALESLDASVPDSFRSEARATVKASRLRLRQMGLSDSQINRAGDPNVNPSNLLLGQAGGTVWVYADLYDYEASAVKTGQRADLTTPAYPGRVFEGTVKSVDPVLNSETRTLRARIEVPNPDNSLKPEMYLTAVIHSSIGKHLALPDTAVMDTGTRQLVYVEKTPGQYEPRQVRVGRLAEGYYEVLDGIQAGDRVVVSANFLIDSESKIRGATP